ncbi:MAG: type III-A CRISPR-associated protein Cas10/Csm1 [Candidatus Margulisbacteria bacterium]|nr:type III-A CRISPR-associated protein Cas10/Csm1 [Candidatus Margulisiibacteriota bacterium]
MNDKEYNTVVLAALLHDIGKPMQFARLNNKLAIKDKHRHPAYSTDIIAHFIFGDSKEWITQQDKNLQAYKMKSEMIDWVLLDRLIDRHHLESKDELEMIIQASDHFSASERSTKEDEDDPNNAIMESIISRLSLDKPTNSIPPTAWYQPKPLTKINIKDIICPISSNDNNDNLDKEQLKNLCKDMLSDLRTILIGWDESNKSADTLISLVDLWLYKYLWMWPSSRGKNVDKDISLYDHCRVATAISACIYKQKDKLKFLEKTKDLKNETKFCLIQGDFSGIQHYIFDITAKQAAKRLRARSAYVQILTENVLRYILNAYKIPSQCALQSSGGKFLILIPGYEKDDIFDGLKLKINESLFNKFRGEINLNLFKTASFKGEDFQGKNWRKIIDKLGNDFQTEKFKPFSNILSDTKLVNDDVIPANAGINELKHWNTSKFVHKLDKNVEECKGCGKPKKSKQVEENFEFCEICSADSKRGRQIVDSPNYLLFFDNDNLIIPEKLKFLKGLVQDKEKPLRMTVLNPGDDLNTKNFSQYMCPISLKFMANYVPNKSIKNEKTEWAKVIEKYEGLPNNDDDKITDTLHFKAIAELSDGNDMLGVLKADVDNLGMLFRDGIPDERYTISRLDMLSRFIDLFFSGYLETLVREEFPECYFVYAGGDDLLMIGPWTSIIELAKVTREKFKEFSANNPSVTLSAGIAFVKPKYPILRAVEQAEEELKHAKKVDGKNAICLWGHALKWEDFKKVYEEMKKLTNWLEENKQDNKKGMSIGMARNLLTFGQMIRNTDKNTANLRWKPLLAYQLARNIDKEKKHEIWEWLEPFISEGKIPKGNEKAEKLKKEHLDLIATYALYRVR